MFVLCLGSRVHGVLITALEYVPVAHSGSVAVVNALRDAEVISSLLIGARQNQAPPTNSMSQPLRNYGIALDMIGELRGGKPLPVVIVKLTPLGRAIFARSPHGADFD